MFSRFHLLSPSFRIMAINLIPLSNRHILGSKF